GETYMIVTPADDRSLDKVLKLIKMSPDEVVLDIDWGAATSGGAPARRGRAEPARKPARAESSRSAKPAVAEPAAPTPSGDEAEPKVRRSRGSRSRKPQVETGTGTEVQATEAAPAADAAPETAAEAPRRSRSRRGQPRRDSAPS